MPELPWQSPKYVAPDAAVVQIAAPEPVMSIKSMTPEQTREAGEMVCDVPSVVEETSKRLTEEFALRVRVPVMVDVPLHWKESVLTAVPVLVTFARPVPAERV